MTDERIKEEYDAWASDVECTENERRFFSQYPAIDQGLAIGFYAGSRIAERLAKIEAREIIKEMRGELLKISQYPIAFVCEEARTSAMEAWKKSMEYTE